MPGTLILCATPIGNLGDLSPRASEVLTTADVIYAEDTRRTAKLLGHIGASTPLKSFFAGNEQARLAGLRSDLVAGRTVVVVSDAGMPVVSDPGRSTIDVAREAGASITSVPGPSAVTTAVALSGFDGDRFVFEGFLDRKGGARTRALESIAAEERTVVLFAAPSRVGKDLTDLAMADPNRRIAVTRELTKLHEELWYGTVGDAADEFSTDERARGEFTLVLEGATVAPPDIDAATATALGAMAGGMSMSDAVREAASAHGVSRRAVYDRVLRERS